MDAAVRRSAFSAFNASFCCVKLAVLHGRGAKTDTWRASNAELPCCGPPARDRSVRRRSFRDLDLCSDLCSDLDFGLDLDLCSDLDLDLGFDLYSGLCFELCFELCSGLCSGERLDRNSACGCIDRPAASSVRERVPVDCSKTAKENR